jgi:hypothetical protein
MSDPTVVVAAATPDAATAAVKAAAVVNAAATNTMIHGRFIAGIALALGLIGIFISLRRQNKKRGNSYEIADLLIGGDGKASKAAHVMFGAFFLTSWAVVYLALTGKLTDVMFAAYLAAWVSPAVTKLIVGEPKPPAT